MNSLTSLRKFISRRSGTLAMVILGWLPMPQVSPKPQLDFTLVSMCGWSHLRFLQQCLFSLYVSWSALPKLQIVSDGSISLSDLAAALAWWPGSKSFSTWQQSVDYHQQRGRESLVEFAIANVMGKKMATILKFGERSPILWCDTDILWFKELSSLPNPAPGSSLPLMKIAEDYQAAYHDALIQQLPHLQYPPFLNAGLIFLSGNVIENCGVDKWLDTALAKGNWFNDRLEQTLFAEAATQLGKDYWPVKEIACFETDKLSFKVPTYAQQNWVARHYIAPVRHLFWRDALFMRLQGIPEEPDHLTSLQTLIPQGKLDSLAK